MNYNEAITILHIQSGASKEEVRKAYHKLAHIHHPDKGGDSKKFVQVKDAYEFLMKNNAPNNFYSKGAGAYQTEQDRKWWNPMTGEWEYEVPTTKETKRSKASTDEGYYNPYEDMNQKREEYLRQQQKVEQMKSDLRKEELKLIMMSMSFTSDFKRSRRGF